jgi:signal peptidase I
MQELNEGATEKARSITDAEEDKMSFKSIRKEWIEPIIIALILAMIIRTFIIQAFKIPSESMVPTLLIGDHLMASKCIYGLKIPFTDSSILDFNKPDRFDVVIFKSPLRTEEDWVKRVVGLPGDEIEIKDRKIFVNGVMVEDKYGFFDDGPYGKQEFGGHGDNYGPISVPPESYFVMGDNRIHSNDSRYWGFVPFANIRGKALFIYWSSNYKAESIFETVRWDRLMRIIE